MDPRISVILPVYNAERYLAAAIDSILAQTYPDFELIIINDCSSDHTPEILSAYTDQRMRVINNASNLKLSKSLNLGIEIARGSYIARMDADDISLPERFEKQVAFLEKHPDIGVLGCWVKRIDNLGNITGKVVYETQPEAIKWELFFRTPLAHPTVMMQAAVIKSSGGFSNDIHAAVDYECWTRLIKTTRFANLPEFLLLYRMHSENMTSTQEVEQLNTVSRLQYFVMTDYIAADKARELVELINLGTRTPMQAIQAAELSYHLYRQYNKIDGLSNPLQIIVRHRLGKRIYRLVSPFHRSIKAWLWLLLAYWFCPELIKDIPQRFDRLLKRTAS
ncbi:MAG: glycosyltransferase [Anaerolineaceae bacterium]|nr:glycosyltransferase [Anaerolineaceae bacterium]